MDSQEIDRTLQIPTATIKISGIGLAALTLAASAMIEPKKSHAVFAALPGHFNLFG
jgi:hypothetical protein